MPGAVIYAKRKGAGICIVCGRNNALPSVLECAVCYAKRGNYNRHWYILNAEKHRARTGELIKQRAAENRCTKCGQPLDPDCDPGYSRCIFCRERDA